MTTTEPLVRVGIAAFVFNASGQILLGKRKGSHGAGTWALPGGHLEFNESFETCAAREIKEETDLNVEGFRTLALTNDIMRRENKHYVTVFLGCVVCDKDVDVVPKIMEPEKCNVWEWTSWEDVRVGFEEEEEEGGDEVDGLMMDRDSRRRLFTPILNLFRQWRGFDPVVSYEGGGVSG
ncbi:hypothetical protein BO94DRAFT_519678 [Aspergillus sclerotioniger CBS 115572]|uniref:Nudix hydrolase domain-containing protein n=1 Tax=Aspergillus sclerotioniger CBS 115572 TaxID=1450535 RepID=A0A317WCM0_9EURO|nr:hypothetical protein BO94DRAFT_519678 [Aspergillus sclerotioniger CBS 115572]PWY83107.1 hypothetical protein BO94DRAFT_519678 [Aspergillus sclerotioniger CBS 115572]